MKVLFFISLIIYSMSYFTNPVIDRDAPDPGILYFKGSYYVVVTGGNGKGGIYTLRKSDDLVNWVDLGCVFSDSTKPSWAKGDVRNEIIK